MFPAVQFKTLRKDRFVMCVTTGLRDSADAKKLGTMFHPKISQTIPLVVKKGGLLYYAADNRLAHDIDPRPIAESGLHEIDSRIQPIVAAKLLEPGRIILFAKRDSN